MSEGRSWFMVATVVIVVAISAVVLGQSYIFVPDARAAVKSLVKDLAPRVRVSPIEIEYHPEGTRSDSWRAHILYQNLQEKRRFWGGRSLAELNAEIAERNKKILENLRKSNEYLAELTALMKKCQKYLLRTAPQNND